MLKTLHQNLIATIDLKDGPTIQALAEHAAASVLTSLLTPSPEVTRAVATGIADWMSSGAPLSDGVAAEVFKAGVERAGRE